jgi:succinate dehydrogenase/fumarate reductase cytochrome b subunit
MCTGREEATSTESTSTEHTCAGHVCCHTPKVCPPAEHVCACQKLLPWRFLHILLGLSLTAFLLVHLSISVAAYRPELYQSLVDRVHQCLNAFPWLFTPALVFILAIQFVTGGYLLFHHGLRYQVRGCNRGGKLRFFLQRISALLVGFFLLFHVGTLCSWGLHAIYGFTHLPLLSRYAEQGLFDPNQAFLSTTHGLQQAWSTGVPQSFGNRIGLMLILLGILAAVYHVTNGMLSGGYVLKISKDPKRKALWTVLSLSIGAVILALGVAAWCAFAFA